MTRKNKHLKIPKQKYTAEFKELPVQRVRAGSSIDTVVQELDQVEQTLCNCVKAAALGMLHGSVTKVVTPEQMELSRLRAENVGIKRENGILKKAAPYLARDVL